jgi:hypothetical protein
MFYGDLSSLVVAGNMTKNQGNWTSYLPFSNRRPEIIGYRLLLCCSKFATEDKNGLDNAIEVGDRRCEASCH